MISAQQANHRARIRTVIRYGNSAVPLPQPTASTPSLHERSTQPLMPCELLPAPLPMIAMLPGAERGRVPFSFLRRMVEASAISRMRLQEMFSRSCSQSQREAHLAWSACTSTWRFLGSFKSQAQMLVSG